MTSGFDNLECQRLPVFSSYGSQQYSNRFYISALPAQHSSHIFFRHLEFMYDATAAPNLEKIDFLGSITSAFAMISIRSLTRECLPFDSAFSILHVTGTP